MNGNNNDGCEYYNEDDYDRDDEKRYAKESGYDRDDKFGKSEYTEIVKTIVSETSAVVQVLVIKSLVTFNIGLAAFRKRFEKKKEFYGDHDDLDLDEHDKLIVSDTVSSSQTSSHGENDFEFQPNDDTKIFSRKYAIN